MPHHLVIADAVEINHRVQVAGRETSIVNFAQIPVGTAVTPTLATDVYNSMGALWDSTIGVHCPPGTTYHRVELRDIRSSGLPLVASSGIPHEGTDTVTENLPRQIAAVLTLRTGRAGRRFRGRAYWCGFSEGANGPDNLITATAKSALNSFATGYMAATNVSGLQLAVAHRPTAFDEITGEPISPGLGFLTIVTQVECRDNIWDTQRRRAG